MAVVLEVGEFDFDVHERCGRPWRLAFDLEAAGALAARWGWPAYEAIAKAFNARWIYREAWICEFCDHVTLWGPGSQKNPRLRRLLADLNAHIEYLQEHELVH